jgi:hypothetical protein
LVATPHVSFTTEPVFIFFPSPGKPPIDFIEDFAYVVRA